MPLISVIVPVFNGEITIRDTIESVLNQSFSDFELITIDDGSQDSSLDIISQIPDSRIKVFSYSNAGLAASRNRGLAQASGEYISFIDADDLWTQDKLEAQLNALIDNPQAGVAYSWTDYIDDSSQFLRRGSHISANGDVLEKLLLVNFLENGSNPLIRREAFNSVGNFDESLPAAQDWDMWLRLAARYHFIAVRSPQILYRVSASSMSANVFRLEAATLQVFEKAYSSAPETLQHLKRYSLANLYKYLTFKALEGSPKQQRGAIAARFFWNAIKNDPSLARHARVMFKSLLKISTVALLPPQQSEPLLTKFKNFADINGLLNYIRADIK
ncbi:glycosyltransferase [Microcoleus sp. FACHB-831]|uniref:glycosyltransferase n=1 Tax=Microcoleus sp. FACHB-831 TaxID=2692827 RepID=UPI001681E763|nr:glycosyltransferase [Microcoleus sp. FACHB-831]MBD1921809.1 glycosyltransferase [Microcoleus sp. FACHB-831]